MNKAEKAKQDIIEAFKNATFSRKIVNFKKPNEETKLDVEFKKIGIRTPIHRDGLEEKSNVIIILSDFGRAIARAENKIIIDSFFKNLKDIYKAHSELNSPDIEICKNKLIKKGYRPNFLITSVEFTKKFTDLLKYPDKYIYPWQDGEFSQLKIIPTKFFQNKSILIDGDSYGVLYEKESLSVHITPLSKTDFDPLKFPDFDRERDCELHAYEIVGLKLEDSNSGIILEHENNIS